jgi:hypothetical protein
LWETWHGGDDGEPLDTFTILTTDANATVAPTHNRMPVIVKPTNYVTWLDAKNERGQQPAAAVPRRRDDDDGREHVRQQRAAPGDVRVAGRSELLHLCCGQESVVPENASPTSRAVRDHAHFSSVRFTRSTAPSHETISWVNGLWLGFFGKVTLIFPSPASSHVPGTVSSPSAGAIAGARRHRGGLSVAARRVLRLDR